MTLALRRRLREARNLNKLRFFLDPTRRWCNASFVYRLISSDTSFEDGRVETEWWDI